MAVAEYRLLPAKLKAQLPDDSELKKVMAQVEGRMRRGERMVGEKVEEVTVWWRVGRGDGDDLQ